jgi:hypothetical protein
MKKILFVAFLVASSAIYGQNKSIKNNSIDLSIGGLGLGISINYSRTLAIKEKYFVVASVGVGAIPSIGGVSIPHSVSYNIGKGSNFLELGLGGCYWQGKSNDSGYTESIHSYQLAPIVGWRKNFANNLNLRLFASPLIHISGEYFYENKDLTPYLGLSFGYGF